MCGEARSHFSFQQGPRYRPVKSCFPSQGWGSRPGPLQPPPGTRAAPLVLAGRHGGAELGPFAAVQGAAGWEPRVLWGAPPAARRCPLRAVIPTESWKPGRLGFPTVASNATVSQVPPGVQGGTSEARTRPRAEPHCPPRGKPGCPPPPELGSGLRECSLNPTAEGSSGPRAAPPHPTTWQSQAQGAAPHARPGGSSGLTDSQERQSL